jgi:hypothetical protein
MNALDLPTHCQSEENTEVHHEDWPVNWHIEDFGRGAEE